jgi:hypothetical protein
MIYALDRNIVMFQNQFLMNVENFILLNDVNIGKQLLQKGAN